MIGKRELLELAGKLRLNPQEPKLLIGIRFIGEITRRLKLCPQSHDSVAGQGVSASIGVLKSGTQQFLIADAIKKL